MFDLNKLGDMAKMASEARKIQASQEQFQREQTELLKKISRQLDSIQTLLEASIKK